MNTDAIPCPEELRRLSPDALERVAQSIRDELVAVGAEIGGHFAGSLGAVELAVSLHATFDTPRDRIVWDVGHQAYAHKILTGRGRDLRRIKQADGPSGFLRRSESPYDAFGAGHAGTSVSAALGMAEAFARMGSTARAVAVLGDGASTAGMSFEALNHGGHLGARLRVVYNDNGMSIAPNVGGLHRTGRKREYFEALGWKVIGPVDGHSLAALLPAVRELRDAEGPCLLHVRTRKGAGFAPAEADPFRWHATTPFDATAGVRHARSAPRTWTHAFADALGRVADDDPRVVAITAAMPDGTGLDRFARRHPDRVYDVGIAEQHAVTFAAGLAAEGLRPVCAIYSSFLQRAFDQIVHDVALQDLPVVFALDRAGLVGGDGPTHHGLLDLAYLRMVPGLVVAAPRDEDELASMLAMACRSERPFAIRFPRGPVPAPIPTRLAARGATSATTPVSPRRVGSPAGAEWLRDGETLALVAIGRTVSPALEAADELATRGISARVLDARFVKPLDEVCLLEAARRLGRIVTIEDHARIGGLGSAVAELVAEHAPMCRLLSLGVGDAFVQHASVEHQRSEAGIDAAAIVARVLGWLEKDALPRTDASEPRTAAPAVAAAPR